jgi:hypothetical protein
MNQRSTLLNGTAKERHEANIFLAFAAACPLKIDPGSARNQNPPRPDIYCSIEGQDHYFELGRVVDRGLAGRLAHSMKTGQITGGAFSQDKPLLDIVRQKSKKTYSVSKPSLDLLIYYDEQVPLFEALRPETRSALFLLSRHMTQFGAWNRLWIYDHNSKKIGFVYPPLTGGHKAEGDDRVYRKPLDIAV